MLREVSMSKLKKINTKQIVPLSLVIMGTVFAAIGVFHLGFWHPENGPQPGFFPTIMAIVMILTSIVALLQSFRENETADYKMDELSVVAAGVGIFVATFIIGLIPTVFAYLIIWLKVVEKSSWKATFLVLGVVAFISLGVFGAWLGVQFPLGVFENIL